MANETTTDIIAEMRDEGHTGESSCLEWVGTKMRYYADRIEAAHKREAAFHAMTCEANDRLREHLQIALDADKRERGDYAKLREALIDVVKRLEAYVGCDHHTFHPTATTCDGITSVGKCGKVATCATIFKARAALAAPPRNCDRFATAEEARQAWLDDAGNWDEFGSPKLELHEWLYAPATEKEGGNDGNE